MRRALMFVSVAVLVLLAPGCKGGGGGNRRRDEPAPEPSRERAREPRDDSEPLPAYAAAPHKWSYYPDEPLYFCDRHQHHWIKEGRRWRHVEQFAGRPNYAAHMLANQSEFRDPRQARPARARVPGGVAAQVAPDRVESVIAQ